MLSAVWWRQGNRCSQRRRRCGGQGAAQQEWQGRGRTHPTPQGTYWRKMYGLLVCITGVCQACSTGHHMFPILGSTRICLDAGSLPNVACGLSTILPPEYEGWSLKYCRGSRAEVKTSARLEH